MYGISINDAAVICGGHLSSDKDSDKEINRVIIDSRSAAEGDLFVAYKGEKVDGHDFINSAFANGASAALAEHLVDGVDKPVIVVDDVQTALEKIAAAFRFAVDCPIVGVTGSVGKTTTKEMIAAVLSEKANVYKTDKNLNNLIGVPMSLSRINQDHDIAVIEMGISIPGEMRRLATMVRPGIMVFTSIGHAHLEFLNSLEGVFNEKTSVLDEMYEDGTVIANGDDEYLKNLKCRQRVFFYGTGDNCDVRAENIVINSDIHACFDIVYNLRRIHITIPAFGRHLIYAALAAATAGFVLGLSDEEIRDGISKFEVVGRRGVVVDTGCITLVDDSYNSNLDSCKMSLLSVMDIPGRHVAVLGDFLEQGKYGPGQHKEVGDYARKLGYDCVIGVGPLGKYTSDINFATNEEFINEIGNCIHKGDIVLVKASLSAHLDQIAEALKTVKL